MNIIASADRNWGIGRGQCLLARIPDDMRFFREMTTGNVVVMGRKTREGIPGGRLKNRINMILTHDKDYQADGIQVVHSLEELREALKPYDTDAVYIAGGGIVYRQLLDACDTAYITKIDFAYDADVYLPDLDQRPEWELVQQSGKQTYSGIAYHFCRYVRRGGNMRHNESRYPEKEITGRGTFRLQGRTENEEEGGAGTNGYNRKKIICESAARRRRGYDIRISGRYGYGYF